jgi:hypothetical protein
MATPGIESVELQGPISRVGAAEPQGGIADLQGAEEKRKGKPGLLGIGDISPADGAVTPRPAGTLRLVASRRLYDQGIAMKESESLNALVEPLVARVNPGDLEAVAVESGQTAKLSTEQGSIEIPVVAAPGVIAGVIEITANVRSTTGSNAGASDLIEMSKPVTDIGLEKL